MKWPTKGATTLRLPSPIRDRQAARPVVPSGCNAAGEVTAPGAEAEAGKPVKVVLYIDFICPVCKNFETQYNETLTKPPNEGKISVEYRPLGFLDTRSTTNYSSRAANAAACVVNESPEKYADFVTCCSRSSPPKAAPAFPMRS